MLIFVALTIVSLAVSFAGGLLWADGSWAGLLYLAGAAVALGILNASLYKVAHSLDD